MSETDKAPIRMTPLTFKFGEAKEVEYPPQSFPEPLPYLDEDDPYEGMDPEGDNACDNCEHWHPPVSGILFLKGTCSLNGARRSNLEWCKEHKCTS